MARTLIMLTGRTHGRTGAREASHRKSAVADLRAIIPISGKPEIGGRRPRRGRSSFETRPSAAPQDDGQHQHFGYRPPSGRDEASGEDPFSRAVIASRCCSSCRGAHAASSLPEGGPKGEGGRCGWVRPARSIRRVTRFSIDIAKFEIANRLSLDECWSVALPPDVD